MAKAGDIVRYLNSVGGGTIIKIEGNIAYVDDDGFETPIPVRECVVIESQKPKPSVYSTPKPIPSKYIEPEKPKEMPVIETQDGNALNVVLAYEASNLKSLSSSDFDTYLVNDSNYFLYFTYMSKNDNEDWTTRYHGIVEPNIQVHLEQIAHADLSNLSRIAIQYIAFKQDKSFKLKNPVFVEQRLDTTKFYKLHCFQENEYFDNPVIALTVVKNDVPNRPMEIDTRELEAAMKAKQDIDRKANKTVTKHEKPKSEIIECDLHITELIDSTAGLSNSDMLEIQLTEFRRVMADNIHHKGTKIVFIHGKGEGVLRKAVIDELKKKYKTCTAQDASFREYGFGATLITIH
ncbi:MAG: DUF2027 domain-containing protein [Muribaculaceae bacterium]